MMNCEDLWQDIIIDEVLGNFFVNILPKCDVKANLEHIQCPIFLAAGMSDYDCCPWFWGDLKNLPPKIKVSIFNESGHYPHYEEPGLFDERIESWIMQQ